MTKARKLDNVTIALDKVLRVQDGSSTTHAAGGIASIEGGKAYSVHVVRIHEKTGSAFTRRGVHYFAALWLNGRKVREDALLDLRAAIVARFKVELAAHVAEVTKAVEAREVVEEAPEVVEAPAEVVEAPAVSLRIYAACLASYNNGILHGAWVNVTGRAAEDLKEDVQAMLATSSIRGAEEFAIHDHEGFGRLIGEWTDLDTVASIGEVLAGPHRLGVHWLIEARGFEVGEAIARAEQVCIHQNDERRWDLAVDWTEDMIAETMDLDKLPDLIRNNIDYQGAARELTINGRLDDHSVGDERFLVTNADEF